MAEIRVFEKASELRNEFKKFDTGKQSWDLLPLDAIAEMHRAFEYGAKKYGRGNYLTAVDEPFSRMYNATLRHLFAFWQGEDLAQDSNVTHLGHAMANIAMIIELKYRGKLVDDRILNK